MRSSDHRPGSASRRTGEGHLTAGLLAVVALGSATLTWTAGSRGLFALDQSILFDGGYRVLSGQVPFRDFVAPVGPVAFWLQGALFALFGIGWRGYLASAAVLDAVAAILAFSVVRRSFPGERWAPLLAAALTGVWFLPPSGTPWLDAVAFLIVLLALWALLRSCGDLSDPASHAGALAGFATGALTVAAFLTKQNAGLAALPLLFATAAAVVLARRTQQPTRRFLRWTGIFALGAITVAGVFLVWLTLAAEPERLVRHVFEIPASVGWERISARPGRTWVTLLTGAGPRPLRALLALSVVPALVMLLTARRRRRDVPIALTGGLFLTQNLFLATSNNQPEISLPFAGLLLALGGRLAWGLARETAKKTGGARERRWARRSSRAMAAVTVLAAIGLVAMGVGTALSRRVHEGLGPHPRFPRSLEIDRLETLRWGQPTVLREGWEGRTGGPSAATEVTATEVERLVEALRHRGEPFFIFPDWTLLYGVVGVPSPQPLLWFHPGLTYPRGGDPALDRWIVAELEGHGVTTVVLEEVSWLGTDRRLDDFPQLRTWLQQHFVERPSIGPFRLLERRTSPGPARP